MVIFQFANCKRLPEGILLTQLHTKVPSASSHSGMLSYAMVLDSGELRQLQHQICTGIYMVYTLLVAGLGLLLETEQP